MLSSGAPPAPEPGSEASLPFPDDPDLWPSIRQERIRTLLGPAMARAEIEARQACAHEFAYAMFLAAPHA